MFFVELHISFLDLLGPQPDHAQLGKLLVSSQRADELAKERRRRNVDGDFFGVQPAAQTGYTFLSDIVWIESCAAEQRTKGGWRGLAGAERGEKGDSIFRADTTAIAVPHGIMNDVTMVLDNTLWLSGG